MSFPLSTDDVAVRNFVLSLLRVNESSEQPMGEESLLLIALVDAFEDSSSK